MWNSNRLFDSDSRSERTSTGITFRVSPVRLAKKPLKVVPYYQAVTEFLDGRVESCSKYHGELVAEVRFHPLIETLYRAFATHRPIAFSPDMIWLTLTQGLACHVNANAEKLRHHFLREQECTHKQAKVVLTVRRDHFIKGSPENPWPEVFTEFSSQIQNQIGDAHELLVANFSTTGPVERAASEIVLMDSMQAYFTYEVRTSCGIPSITLEGSVDDWRSILHRVREFRRFELDWWIDAIEPLLHQFVAAAEGKIDRPFWDSIYKFHGSEGSGKDPFVTGWILNFFPYLNPIMHRRSRRAETPGGPRIPGRFVRNEWIHRQRSEESGPTDDRFPHQPARAPFIWKYFDHSYEMEFIGGLIGIAQDAKTFCLRPEIGWAVWQVGAEARKREVDAEAARKKQAADAEIAAKALAAMNYQANRHFDDARSLGLQFHQRYIATRPTYGEEKNLDENQEHLLLLNLAIETYQSNLDFQKLWNTVHGQPPAAAHTKWLSLWKKA